MKFVTLKKEVFLRVLVANDDSIQSSIFLANYDLKRIGPRLIPGTEWEVVKTEDGKEYGLDGRAPDKF